MPQPVDRDRAERDRLAAEDQDIRKRLWDAVRQDPEGMSANLAMGIYCASRHRFMHLAEPYMLKALSKNPPAVMMVRALHSLGLLYKRRGDLGLADRTYDILTQVMPEDPQVLFDAGDAAYLSGDLARASDRYRTANALQERAARDRAEHSGEPLTRILGPIDVISLGFGELATSVDMVIKARTAGWLPNFHAILVVEKTAVKNLALLERVGDLLAVVTDPAETKDVRRRWAGCDYDTLHFPGPDGRWYYRNVAYRLVQAWWMQQGRPPVFRLGEEDRRKGEFRLRELGVPPGGWFVTLHVREAKDVDGAMEADPLVYRNGRIESYLPAIQTIVERGGWVVRVGDSSMTPLPPMKGVIDYACALPHEDWFDLYLLGACRFLVGMASGPVDVALAFGVPVVGTNWFPPANWPLGKEVIFVPKLIRRRDDGQVLSLREASKPPFANNEYAGVFHARGLEAVDNEPEEIRAAVVEMLERLDGAAVYTDEDEALRRAFLACADPYGLGVPWRPARDFLRRHADKLG